MIVSYLTLFEGASKWYEEIDVYPALLEGLHSFLRVSVVIDKYPIFSEDLMVISILAFPSDMGFVFCSS